MYEIRGKYPGEPWETIDEADTKQEANRLLAEYRMAYGPEWRLCIKKVAAGAFLLPACGNMTRQRGRRNGRALR